MDLIAQQPGVGKPATLASCHTTQSHIRTIAQEEIYGRLITLGLSNRYTVCSTHCVLHTLTTHHQVNKSVSRLNESRRLVFGLKL